MKQITTCGIAILYLCAICNTVLGQAEVSGWGNLRGIRVGGQLVPFTTAVGVYNPDFSQATLSQREGPTHTSQYVRNGNVVTVGESLQYNGLGVRGAITNAAGALGAAVGVGGRAATTPATNPAGTPPANPAAGRGARGGRGPGGAAGGFNYTITYTDSAPGTCDVQVHLTSAAAQTIGGVYYFMTLPGADFGAGTVEFTSATNSVPERLADVTGNNRPQSGICTGVILSGTGNQKVEVHFPQASNVVVQRTRGRGVADIQVYFPIIVGNTTAGQVADATFTLKASGDVDTTPVTVSVDSSKTGREWLGMGGNYRLQSPRDQQHIQYILDNMRVAFGRVAMPWNLWQPDQNAPPPLTVAGAAPAAPGGRGGGGNVGGVVPSMQMAQTLAKQNIPMIISCWQPPNWAVLPNAGARGGGGGGGQRLDPAKYGDIAKSIGSYLVYLRDHYGAEPILFSFNESNVGINVRQSPQDHDDAIKILGAEFKSLGLKTKMLLGDTGDAPPVNFIQTALNDPAAVPFIGAISFHSWRGASDAQYQAWADAATKLGVPLIDAEGGNDAQASGYPNVFREQWYSLDEAAEYVRIMRICQPEAILEWQLTENYSVLTPGPGGALQPTQRFFNLKQFNLAPAGSQWISVQSSNGLVLPAAFFDKTSGQYTVHMVNNGAGRQVTLTGLPASVTKVDVYVTDATHGMTKSDPVMASNGSAQFTLVGQALTTLVGAGK